MNSSSPTTNTRRPCFIEEDNGLASLAKMKAEFSANTHNTYYNTTTNKNHTALHRKRSSSLRNLASLHGVLSPRSAAARLYFDARHEDQQQQPYFLDACFLCKKPLGDRDIFMYRGDTPFCSEECRQEQIEMDEAKEKSLNLSASMKALSKKDQRRSTSPNNCTFRTSTVAAA